MKVKKLETIVEFLDSLNSLQTYDNELFSLQVLECFDKYLGFCHSAMVVLDNGCVVSSYGHNISEYLGMDYDNVLDNDYIAVYIKNNQEKIKKEGRILCSTELFTTENNEYVNFIEERLGMHYAVIFPFKEVYMAIYHAEEEGDFTEEEKSLLNSVYKFLRRADALRYKNRNEMYVSNFKNTLIDEMKVGFLVFDGNFNLIYNNRYAMQGISSMLGTTSKGKVFEKLYEVLGLTEDVMKADGKASYMGYTIEFQHFYKDEVYGIARHFIRVTIKKETAETGSTVSTNNFSRELTKREEEIINCLAAGMQYQEAADYLMISINTFRTHIKNIYKKIGVNNQHELLKQYYSE